MFVPPIFHPYYKMGVVSATLQKMFPQDNFDSMTTNVRDVSYELFGCRVSCHAISESQDDGLLSDPLTDCENESSSWLQEFHEMMSKGNPDLDDISNLFYLDLYLRERNEVRDCDVLKWWRIHVPKYPIISRMARDVLAIPFTTVPSESTFTWEDVTLHHTEFGLNLR